MWYDNQDSYRLKLAISLLIGFISLIALGQTKKPAEKLRRADCFFGVHFDLHASEDITDAGKSLTPEMIDTFLTKVKPDYIQVDCKGHPGISSYPTKAGYHVKGFEKDPLKLFRDVTEKNNVGLFVHYSGVMDTKAVTEHPDWAIVNANGETNKQNISFFSPYLESLMIPQLKEISDYKVDGAWIDGDNWAVRPDYGKASLERFTRETGVTEIPKSPSDKYYPEFIEYTRSLFREYVKNYVDAIHKYNPKFQITSNWAYSSMMPEKVNISVDFLSGDLPPLNAVYSAAFEARCLAPQGKPWDLMSWGFSWNWENGGVMPRSNKSAVQLEQEAAQVLAMGGGIQFYYSQRRDLSIKPWIETSLSEIAAFCMARQSFCHKSKAIPQIALLYPASYQRNASSPYSRPGAKLQGTLNVLLDGQNSVEILMEHHLLGKMNQYPLIIIAECNKLDSSFKNELIQYVQNGGNLLILGTETTKLFEKELGVKSMTTTPVDNIQIAASNTIGAIRSPLSLIELQAEAEATSVLYDDNDFRCKGKTISSSVNKIGKGKIGAVYFNAGTAYDDYKSPVLRDFISNRIAELFPDPIVKVTGSHLAHVTVNTLNNRMYVNLVNIAGEHTNETAVGYDEIPYLKNIAVSIKTIKKPSKIYCNPKARN